MFGLGGSLPLVESTFSYSLHHPTAEFNIIVSLFVQNVSKLIKSLYYNIHVIIIIYLIMSASTLTAFV